MKNKIIFLAIIALIMIFNINSFTGLITILGAFLVISSLYDKDSLTKITEDEIKSSKNAEAIMDNTVKDFISVTKSIAKGNTPNVSVKGIITATNKTIDDSIKSMK